MDHSERSMDMSDNNGTDDITDDITDDGVPLPPAGRDQSSDHPQMTEDPPLDHPQMTEDPPLDHPQMTEDPPLDHPQMTEDPPLDHPQMTEEQSLAHTPIIEEQSLDHSQMTEDQLLDHPQMTDEQSLDHSQITEDQSLDQMTEEKSSEHPHMTEEQSLDYPQITEDQSLDQLTEDHEDLIILDPEHPLVRRYQAALKKHLSQQLDRLNAELKEKLSAERAEAQRREQLGERLYGVQEQLSRSQVSVERQQEAAALAARQRQLTQDQLQDAKQALDGVARQADKERTHVSQLQAEMDNLIGRLLYMQQVNADVQSDVSAMRNASRKAQQDKSQAAAHKHRQDMYVDKLTRELDRLTEQIHVYEDQLKTQQEETHAATEALTEAQMEMDSLQMEQKQLLQQWNSSLMDMKQQDRTFTSMQEALSSVQQEVLLLEREVEGVNRSVTKEQERNELLTAQLRRAHLAGATARRQIDHSQAQQDALQASYSTYTRTLHQTEGDLRRLNVESTAQGAELGGLTNQLERQSSACVDLTNRIVELMQREVTHSKDAQHRKQLRSKMAALRKDKTSQLWQLENEAAAASLAGGEAAQRLAGLQVSLDALEGEVSRCDALLAAGQAKMAAGLTTVQRKQDAINACNKKIQQLMDSTGHADLSPLQIKAESLSKTLEELRVRIRDEQQLWSRQQMALVRLSQDRLADTERTLTLRTQYTLMENRRARTEGHIAGEQRELKAVEKNMKTLRSDVLKLNSLLSQKGALESSLETDNNLMHNTCLHALKEAEGDALAMQNRLDNILDEKKNLLNVLMEAEHQIMLWEKKIQVTKESRAVVDSDVGREELRQMKSEIHRMEVHYGQLTRRQQQLMRDSEACVSRRDGMVVRREAQGRAADPHHHHQHQALSHSELNRSIAVLQRNTHALHKQVAEYEQQLKELLSSKASLGERLHNQRLHAAALQEHTGNLTSDLRGLQDTKERNFLSLLSLQTRAKHLQKATEGRYTSLTACSGPSLLLDQQSGTSPSARLEQQLEQQAHRVQAVRTIVHRVCEQSPQHQETLRRLSLTLFPPAPGN